MFVKMRMLANYYRLGAKSDFTQAPSTPEQLDAMHLIAVCNSQVEYSLKPVHYLI